MFFSVDPVVERKLRRDRKPITNEKIELFNLAAVKVLCVFLCFFVTSDYLISPYI